MKEPKIQLPIKGNYRITFRFGEAPKWYTDVFGYPHNGVDLACVIGTPVRACDDGEVIFCDNVPGSNGLGIILKHDWGTSLYWHNSENIARVGAKVKRGQEIAKSGKSGFATGPHVHFGIKVNGVNPVIMKGWVDPLLYVGPVSEDPVIIEPICRYYIVRPGDSLFKIALKFYNDGRMWQRIYKANAEKIKNPNLIYPLQRLFIP